MKKPVKGGVKSRLAAAIGDEAALCLYECFVLDFLDTLSGGDFPVSIHAFPPETLDDMKAWLGPAYEYVPQKGGDLGERMSLAFEDAFERGYREALLIGTDIPDLPLDVIHEAFSAVKTHDVVLGPARDGGYYLIGFRQASFVPEIFDGMPWGAADVCARTMDVFRRSGKSVHMLPAWGDVDTARDLADLVERNGETAFRTSRTMTYIMENLKRENLQ